MSYVSPKTGKQYVLLTLPGEAAIELVQITAATPTT